MVPPSGLQAAPTKPAADEPSVWTGPPPTSTVRMMPPRPETRSSCCQATRRGIERRWCSGTAGHPARRTNEPRAAPSIRAAQRTRDGDRPVRSRPSAGRRPPEGASGFGGETSESDRIVPLDQGLRACRRFRARRQRQPRGQQAMPRPIQDCCRPQPSLRWAPAIRAPPSPTSARSPGPRRLPAFVRDPSPGTSDDVVEQRRRHG